MIDDILDQIQAGIRRVLADPTLRSELTGWTRTVLMKVDSHNYTIKVENGSITALREKTRHFDVEVRLNKTTFMEIAAGRVPFTTAYLRGLLTVKGDVQASDISRLQKLL